MEAQHSDTSEFRLFRKVANPLKVDFHHKRVEELPPSESDDDDVQVAAPPVVVTPLGPGPPASPPPPAVQPPFASSENVSSFPSRPEAPESDEDDDHVSTSTDASSVHSTPRASTQEEIDREKQGYLLELDKLAMQGTTGTRKYTMDDTLEAIQYEYERIKMNMDTVNAVHFMRDVLKLALTGIELANAKLGPVLHLDGWSTEVTTDMNRYDHCLERLYKKHWRKGSMSPSRAGVPPDRLHGHVPLQEQVLWRHA